MDKNYNNYYFNPNDMMKIEVFNFNQNVNSIGSVTIGIDTSFQSFLTQLSSIRHINLKKSFLIYFKIQQQVGGRRFQTDSITFNRIKELIFDMESESEGCFVLEETNDQMGLIIEKKVDEVDISVLSEQNKTSFLNYNVDKTRQYLEKTNTRQSSPVNLDLSLSTILNHDEESNFADYKKGKGGQGGKGGKGGKEGKGGEGGKEDKGDKLQTKIMLNNKEIQIKEGFIEEFNDNLDDLKCMKCENILFGAKTCKDCLHMFCNDCFTKSKKCPDDKCLSETYIDNIPKSTKVKLSNVKLECENECSYDNITIFNYLDHLKSECPGT